MFGLHSHEFPATLLAYACTRVRSCLSCARYAQTASQAQQLSSLNALPNYTTGD